jgi:hypothetical protein
MFRVLNDQDHRCARGQCVRAGGLRPQPSSKSFVRRPMTKALALSVAALSLVACIERRELSADMLGRAVRDAGFSCEGAVGASELEVDVWRVACGGGSTFIASVLASGHICVDPMPIGDVGPVFQELDENRCAPNVKAQ